MPPRLSNTEAFAERLRNIREQRKLSLQQIADRTKIGISQLRALERGDIETLPEGIYRRAIIRQYAEALDVDVEEALRELTGLHEPENAAVEVTRRSRRDERDEGTVGFAAALWTCAFAFSVLGAFGVSLGSGWSRNEPPGPAVETTEETVEPDARDIELDAEGSAAIPVGPDAPASEGELRIATEPAGAQVTVNGIGWDVSPVTIRYLPFGEQVIRVTKAGYSAQERNVELNAGSPSRSIRVVLSPTNAAP